jgi:hypothetical protein
MVNVETPYGTKLIKEFFSEAMKTTKEKMFQLEIKENITKYKKKERKPLPDDQLADLLKKRMSIAHETIAKYREQLRYSLARMRKKYKSFFKFILNHYEFKKDGKLNRLKFVMVYLRKKNSYL